ncbi:extracellular solute-binding protein [Marispirochaeta aestuarii]|uniref:ABC transporter substrate-binding protein n=1 Tax=Marispirochaeta aestuarii TaxID=1963862 RepID=UPI0029C6DE86|nr:extracellular solute-binding protein [Marispirochaeta aestuarii]
MYRTVVKRMMVVMVVVFLMITPLLAGGQGDKAEGGPTALTLWTSNAIHGEFYMDAAKRWNSEYPDQQIELEVVTTPNVEMHNQLTLAFQAGVGAPDIVDININFFSNFLKGDIQLVPLNDVVDPVRDSFVESRFDIYSKDGKVYGLPLHVGATVVYYNMEMMDKAGVDVEAIKTWDDFEAAGRKVRDTLGIPMTIIETADQRPFWPMIVQRGGDYLGPDGSVTLDSDINIEVLERLHSWMFEQKIAVGAPGGKTWAEEFFPFMNNGGFAALIMPTWYMSRFLEFMPDIAGKIAVRPMPVWEEGDARSCGIGGTGSSVTTQSEHIELAKKFNAYAKLTVESNKKLWEIMRFDPPRWDGVWDSPELLKPDPYFYNEPIFEMLIELAEADQIPSPNSGELLADAQTVVRNSVSYWVFEDQSRTPEEALREAAAELRRK